MRNAVKLTFFFTVSVALHGAGLWAAMGSLESRSAEPSAEVAIVDRDLFFRHAARSERLASQPASAGARLVPEQADTVRPSDARASVAAAPAPAATAAEPERAATPASDAMARLEPSVLEATPSSRQEAVAPEDDYAERREPDRMVAVASTPSPAATAPRVEPSAREPRTPSLAAAQPLQAADDAAQASRAPALPPEEAPSGQPAQTPVEAEELVSSPSPADPLAPTGAEAAERRPLDVIETAPPAPPPLSPLEQGVSERAPRLAATEGPRIERSSPLPSAGEPSPAPVTAPAPAQSPTQPDRPLREAQPPAPIAPREAQVAEAVGPSAPTAPSREASRLAPAQAGAPEEDRPSLAGVPRRAAQPAERIAARVPQPAPFRPPVPDPDTAEAPPGDLAALPPAMGPEVSGGPTFGTSDSADLFTSAYKGGECFFPLRVASADGGPIQGYGVEAESVRRFRQAFAETVGTDPDVVWRPLTDAQCAGISFTRLILGESAPSLQIGLERKELAIGEGLSGRVSGSRSEFVTLLILDDSGLVHNVLKYLRPGAAGLEFSVPVQPVDEGRDRVQLIMAVGASRPLAVLKWSAAVHSDDFFTELVRQAVDAGATLELGLADFVILGSPR